VEINGWRIIAKRWPTVNFPFKWLVRFEPTTAGVNLLILLILVTRWLMNLL